MSTHRQLVTVDGKDLIILLEDESGLPLRLRRWKGAAQYLRPSPVAGYINVMIPEKATLQIELGDASL